MDELGYIVKESIQMNCDSQVAVKILSFHERDRTCRRRFPLHLRVPAGIICAPSVRSSNYPKWVYKDSFEETGIDL